MTGPAFRALLIGVHEGCTTIGDWARDLPAVRNDISTLTRLLTDGTVWDLPPDDCTAVLQPATPRDVLDRLEDAATQATDTLFVYLAGHAVLDGDGRLYLVLPGARFDYHCLPFDQVRSCLARHRRARNTVVVIDCCLSGNALGGALDDQDQADLTGQFRDLTLIDGAVVLTACSAHLAAVAPEGAEYTVFTGELIKVLTEGVPGRPALLTMQAVREDLVGRLRSRPGLPIPQLGTRGPAGRIPLFRNRAFQAEATVPRPATVRFRYLRQVEQIAPRSLVGRAEELAELAAFCNGPDATEDPGYLWWRAPAWSGKSALLAWFTLHPPERTRVVAFFITARYSGQADLNAFLTAMIEQLTALVGRSAPDGRLDRLPWFHELLEAAAQRCRERGERLVLLVDGLDEDRGVGEGLYRNSIAAALPSRLPAGTRAVLSGRPHPPVPDDVPPSHPLRDVNIIRPLTPWGGAENVREYASFELTSLLTDSELGYEVLALLIAAGGGLSVCDLAELTGKSAWRIEDLLLGSAGRTFTRRPCRRDPDNAVLAALVLAHGELTVAAEAGIGAPELASYADRIHAWADGYRDRDWPVETPEYLLTGYLPMLRRAGMPDRMAAYVSDTARADRLFALTGGDSAVLEDIAEVQRFLCDRDEPDLGRLLALAIARDRFTVRNARLPTRLPVVWAGLGQADRAESLARGMNSSFSPAESLIELVKASAESGDDARAWELAMLAEAVISGDPEALGAVHALLKLIRAVLPTGDPERIGFLVDRAEEMVDASDDLNRANFQGSFAEVAALCGQADRAIRVADRVSDRHSSLDQRGLALAIVVEAFVRSERIDDARRASQLITDPVNTARALTALLPAAFDVAAAAGAVLRVAELLTGRSPDRAVAQARLAEALVGTGRDDHALRVLDAIDYAHEPGRSYLGVEKAMVGAFCRLARAATERHDPERALAFLDRAEHVAGFINLSMDIAAAVQKMATELVRAGAPDRAERLVAAITDCHDRDFAVAALARDVARAGGADQIAGADQADADRAGQAERIASGIEDPYAAAVALADLAEVLVEQGDRRRAGQLAERAESMARTWTAPTYVALSELVDAVGEAGDPARARRIAVRAEQAVRAEAQPAMRDLALADVAKSLARLGDVEGAARIGESLGNYCQDMATVEVALAMARSGDTSTALRMAGAIREPRLFHEALTGLAVMTARGGDRWRAMEMAQMAEKALWRAFTPDRHQAKLAEGIVLLMEAVEWIGDDEWLRDLAERAMRIVPYCGREKVAIAWVAEALARAGDLAGAEAVADTPPDATSRIRAHAKIAHALARAGDVAAAERIVAGITARHWQAEAIALLAEYAVPSRRLVADALCRESYTAMLFPVARVDPAAVLRAADLIEGAE